LTDRETLHTLSALTQYVVSSMTRLGG